MAERRGPSGGAAGGGGNVPAEVLEAMQAVAGWVLIGVSVLTSWYVARVSEGQVSYFMLGPALLGAVLIYRHWRDG